MPTDAPRPTQQPAPLPDAVLGEALKISNWCEEQRKEALKTAQGQIRVVWMLLLGGLVLLLLLPRVIQEIDFAWRKDSLPPAIMERAKATENSIARNNEEMENEATDANTRLTELKAQRDTAIDDQKKIEDTIRESLSKPYAVWRDVSPKGYLDLEVIDIKVIAGTVWVAALIRSPSLVANALLRWNGTEFEEIIPRVDGQPLDRITSIAEAPNGRIVLAGLNAEGTVVASAPLTNPKGEWDVLISDTSAPDNGFITTLLPRADGSILLAGSEARDELDYQYFASLDSQGKATPIAPELMQQGSFYTGLLLADGRVLIGGLAPDAEGSFGPALILFENDNTGRNLAIAQALFYRVIDLVQAADGEVIAIVEGTETGGYALQLPNNTDLSPPRKLGNYSAVVKLSDGTLLGAGIKSTRGGPRAFLQTISAEGPQVVTEYELVINVDQETSSSSLVFRGFSRLVAAGPEQVFGESDNNLVQAVSPNEALLLAGDLINPFAASREVLLPAGTAVRQLERKLYIDRRSQLSDLISQQQGFVDAAEASHKRQESALTEFSDLSVELEQALRNSEPVRQLAQIATRLAVIGLLIYLVQIVVNRYRYLQRLAGYYQARAHAFSLLAAQGNSSLLQGITLADVTAMLSPDSIGFDKSAEPPTSEMVSLLQAGLRKA